MNVLVIYAHPSKNSLNHAIKEAFLEGLKKAGHTYELSDLYEDGFNPILSESELKHGEVPSDIQVYREKINKADYIAFIFPIWWYRAPAILEGWLDRVFSSDFGFKYVPMFGERFYRPVGLLCEKKVISIETYGGPKIYYWFLVPFAPFKRFKKGVLGFCGIKKVLHYPLYSAAFKDPVPKKKFLEAVRKIGEKIN